MITAPLETDPRAQWADWLEVQAMLSSGWVGDALVSGVIGIASNEDRDTSDAEGTSLDGEIVDEETNRVLDDIAAEIGFRKSSLEMDYPFEINPSPFAIRYVQPREPDLVHDIYLFNLLMSAVAQSLVKATDLGAADHDHGRRLFHVCASLGVAGLLEEPETYWFGFPRPERTGFCAALGLLSERLGYAIPKDPAPPGLPEQAKDDQVDVIGWRTYGDKRVGTLVVLCQAATGNNWRAKSIRAHIEAFAEWFERSPYGLAWPSLAYPFVAHHELMPQLDENFEAAVYNYLKRLNQQYGTLLDRLRIVQGARAVANRGNTYADSKVAGWKLVPDIQAWKDSALLGLKAA